MGDVWDPSLFAALYQILRIDNYWWWQFPLWNEGMGDVWDPSLCATLYQTVPAEQMKQIAQQQTRLRSRKEENKLIFL